MGWWVRIIIVRGPFKHDGRVFRQDEILDLPDDEAAAILAASDFQRAAMPEAEAPRVLVTWDWQNGGPAFKAGWIGHVSPETRRTMLAYGIGVPWPAPPDAPPPDPEFRAMPPDWKGGPLREVVHALIFAAPEVRAFEALKDGLHGTFALSGPSLPGSPAPHEWTHAEWAKAFSAPPPPLWKGNAPTPRPWMRDSGGWARGSTSADERNRRGRLAWFRNRELLRLGCAVFDRLRSGDWLASGIRDDTPEAAREEIPPDRWDHPRYVLQWERAGAALRPAKDAPAALPHFACLEVWPAPTEAMGTARAETRCRRWIAETARAHPDAPPKPKPEMKAEAVGKFGVSGRSFGRAWDDAAPAAWKSPGRRKSNHRAE